VDDEVQLFAFDIMALDGEDLRQLPLSLRKTNLARLLARRPDGIFVAPYEQGEIGNRCITGFDPYTANLDHAHGQDPKRSPATTEPFPLEAQSLLPALPARRTDRPGRPQGDNDIAEQYKNPSKAFPRAP
jgi:hypothetical protein